MEQDIAELVQFSAPLKNSAERHEPPSHDVMIPHRPQVLHLRFVHLQFQQLIPIHDVVYYLCYTYFDDFFYLCYVIRVTFSYNHFE